MVVFVAMVLTVALALSAWATSFNVTGDGIIELDFDAISAVGNSAYMGAGYYFDSGTCRFTMTGSGLINTAIQTGDGAGTNFYTVWPSTSATHQLNPATANTLMLHFGGAGQKPMNGIRITVPSGNFSGTTISDIDCWVYRAGGK